MKNCTRIIAVAAATLVAFSIAAAKEVSWKDQSMQVAKHYFAGDDVKALAAANTALKTAELKFGPEHPFVASTLNDLAAVQKAARNYSASEQAYTRAIYLLEKAADVPGSLVAHPLTGLGDVMLAQGKLKEAAKLYERAIGVLLKDKDQNAKGALAHPLLGLAQTFARDGNLTEAENRYKQALDILVKAVPKDDPVLVMPLHDLGEVYRLQKNYPDAEKALKRAVAILEKNPKTGKEDLAQTAGALVALYQEQGKSSDAKALEKKVVAASDGDLLIAKRCFRSGYYGIWAYRGPCLGSAFAVGAAISTTRSWGSYWPVVNYATRTHYADTHQPVPNLVTTSTDPDLENEEKEKDNSKPIVVTTAREPAVKPCDIDKLRELIAQAKAKRQKNNSENRNVETETGPPDTTSQKQRADAAQSLIRALKTTSVKQVEFVPVPQTAEVAFSENTQLALMYEDRGDFQKAAQYFRQAIAATEEVRAGLSPQNRGRFGDMTIAGRYFTAPYEGLARSLIKLNDPLGALKASEQAKAYTFAESLASGGRKTMLDLPGEVLRNDNELTDKVLELKKQRQQVYEANDKTAAQNLEVRIKEAENKRQSHIKVIKENYPLFAAARYPDAVDLGQSALKPEELVLSYDVTDTALLVYLCKGKELVKEFTKPVRRSELDQLVRSFRQPLELRPGENVEAKLKAFDFAAGKTLADLLLADVLPLVEKNVPLVIVPDDTLTSLPFEMLVLNHGGKIGTDKPTPYVEGADFFGDRNPISYHQSIASITVSRRHAGNRPSEGKTLVIVDPVFSQDDERVAARGKAVAPELRDTVAANRLMSVSGTGPLSWPRLKLTSQLGQALKLADPGSTDVLSGLDAQKSRILNTDLAPYKWLVFGTHGYLGRDLEGIRDAVLVFSRVDQPKDDDGYLRPGEVMGLKMAADIVALTACQSGLARESRSGGALGMGQAFRYAGAKTVLVSLWAVEQRTSVALVEIFFKHLRDGKSKPEALKLAREELRRSGHDHPFYWAPFILIGEVGSEAAPEISFGSPTRTASIGSRETTAKSIGALQVKLSLAADKDVYRIGDEIGLRLTANRDCRVYVFEVGTDGTTSLIFPNKYQPSDRVEKDKTCAIPSKDSPLVLRVQGPEGTNYVTAVATTEPLTSGPGELNLSGLTLAQLREKMAKDKPDAWTQTQIELKIRK